MRGRTTDGHDKIVRDIVYGYIDLRSPRRDVLSVVDTPLFQRLKRIAQLTAFSLYPSANHTRFEHSLGVMHLGSLVFANLEENSDIKGMAAEAGTSVDVLRDTVTYACLLHDIGHAAFSHVGERFYQKETILESIKQEDAKLFENVWGAEVKGDEHELMSCLVLLKAYAGQLPGSVDLELACRMISNAEYPLEDEKRCLNPVIEILNSPYDVDRLDYVLRDSRSTGTFGVSIDYERIIRGYAIRDNTLLFLKKSIPCVVNLITGRDFLYQWLYNHHTVAYTDLLVEDSLRQYFGAGKDSLENVFSMQAIETGVDDHTVWRILHACRDEEMGHARRIFERRFHHAVWKTPYDFEKDGTLSAPKRSKLLDLVKGQGREADNTKVQNLRAELCRHMPGVAEGDLLISMRPVKHFNPVTNRTVHFWIHNRAVAYHELSGGSPFASGPTDYPLIFFDPCQVTRDDVVEAIDAVV